MFLFFIAFIGNPNVTCETIQSHNFSEQFLAWTLEKNKQLFIFNPIKAERNKTGSMHKTISRAI